MLKNLINFFSSLKLTVILLIMGFVIVFWGTMAQVHLGLYKAQAEFFRSFFVYWQPGAGWKIPIFPGGYLVGGLLLVNLFVAHVRYWQPGRKKIGLAILHLGIVLLLLGQILTDVLSQESVMHLRDGQTKNYSESERNAELAVLDTTDTNSEKVVAIPGSLLTENKTVKNAALPFEVRVKDYFPNSELSEKSAPGLTQVGSNAGYGGSYWWRRMPRETSMDRRDIPSAVVEIVTAQGSLGTFLVSEFLDQAQQFTCNGRRYELLLRPQRFYNPFSLQLLEFQHDKYPGTDIPKNFSSRVRLHNPQAGEDREVLIHMNDPLRYDGKTFYQASFDPDDHGSVLQVVRNPGWLTPYLACALVGIGLAVQFLTHLVPFLKRRFK